MAKNSHSINRLVLFIFVLLLGIQNSCVTNAQTSATSGLRSEMNIGRQSVSIIDYRACVVDWYMSKIGIREKTGNNDGVDVEYFLSTVGLGKGAAWCAAFVHAGLIHCGVENNITGWSPTAYDPKKVVYFKGQFFGEPQSGDVATIYFPSKRRIAHAMFYHKRRSSSIFESVEGNTNSAGSREGDGVYKKIRSFHSIYSICDFIKK